MDIDEALGAHPQPTKVMLDPSLLVRGTALEKVVAAIPSLSKEQAGFEFYVAASAAPPYADTRAYGAVSAFFEAGAEFVDPGDAIRRLNEVGVTVWERPSWASQEFADFFQRLGETIEPGPIREIIFDEWFFLTHESWVVSRIKAAFNAMVHAGELGIELLNRLVRRTLREDESYVVQTADRMRALAKWLAVGGPAVATLLNPIVGAFATVGAGGFLLIDPPDEN